MQLSLCRFLKNRFCFSDLAPAIFAQVGQISPFAIPKRPMDIFFNTFSPGVL